jgi:hypothetical protein
MNDTRDDSEDFGLKRQDRTGLDPGTDKANNLQQSWRFDWEPPKAVLRDVMTIDRILRRLRSSAQADSIAGRPVLGF